MRWLFIAKKSMTVFKPRSGTMRNKRFQSGDRRQSDDKPRAPFKDSNGKLILVCRRRIPDRRLHNIEAEWIDETVIQ